jgi:hypothetical protein
VLLKTNPSSPTGFDCKLGEQQCARRHHLFNQLLQSYIYIQLQCTARGREGYVLHNLVCSNDTRHYVGPACAVVFSNAGATRICVQATCRC